MRVIAHVLCKVDDHRYVVDQADESEAIAELMKMYNQLANRSTESSDPDDHLFVVGPETYGSDLKQWISLMPTHDKWRILDRYLSHFPKYAEGDAKTERQSTDPLPSRETEEEKDKRKLRQFAIRFGIIVVFLMTLLVFAAAMALMSTKHMLPDNVIVKAVFETATELAKILFTLK